ncbi:helix-turn-helix domain-containing protein [Desulfovibrio legallii]|jgi:transcriptional regulator with XRE-family HTH domain|uniref:helix-turn-helix domain-containing protein n=1 Tax=Desulfovibrio legallii TaxID=571438 RepID=UPI001177C364|nr:helix-turn-helix transcriptional regulator [Desulfovibrio legallii]
MNIETFRTDLQRAIREKGLSQSELARLAGIRQGTLSKFLTAENGRDMNLSTALRLWPFVYGAPPIPATPATSPASAQAQAAAQ